ncbi:hypothetical protein DL96DRAFT_1581456 [Flagelloscypha sp. PMI_526]|nr:hypothetical protein DL96DRAFT_1581456 [Flagelloscypha sp. PMI_526]
MTPSLPLDILDEISSYLSKSHLCTIAIVHSSILPYMRRRLYRSLRLNHAQIGLVMLSPSSSRHLVHTISLHIYITQAVYANQTVQLLECLRRHGQLRTLGVASEHGAFSENPTVPSAFQDLTLSLPFLHALDICIDPNEGTTGYTHFLQHSLRHPALRQLGLSVVPKTLNHLKSLDFFPKPTEMQVAFGTNRNDIANWIPIMAWTSLSKVQILTVRNIGFSISAFGAMASRTVTRLNLAVTALDMTRILPSLLPEFTQLAHLSLACHRDSWSISSNYLDMIRALTPLVKHPINSFEVFIPINWITVRSPIWWNNFSHAVKSSSTLRLVRLYFAGSVGQKQQRDLIRRMASQSLSVENISIFENAKIADMWPQVLFPLALQTV